MFIYIHGYSFKIDGIARASFFYTYKFKIFFFNLLNKTFSYIIKLG